MIIPVGGALIGWLTIVLAVKLIFRKVLPERRDTLAVLAGKLIEDKVLSAEDLVAELKRHAGQAHTAEAVSSAIKKRVMAKMPGIFPLSVRTVVGEIVRDMANREIPSLLTQLVQDLGETIKEEVNFGRLVEKRVKEMDLLELEKQVRDMLGQELAVARAGAAGLGLVIGLSAAVILRLA